MSKPAMNSSADSSSGYFASFITVLRRKFRTTRTRVIGVVLITTAISLLFAGAVILTNDIGRYRNASQASLNTEAAMLGLATAPALAFDDRDAAARNLAALKARPEIAAAALYLPNGSLYAEYLRQADEPAPPTLQRPIQSSVFDGQQLTIIHRIQRNDELLGTLYIRARFDVYGGAKAYAGILAVVMMVAMVIAWALSNLLQRLITAPLSDMAGVARRIIEAPDYSLRAQKSGDDEIGVVVDAFNKMLGEVQLRTLDLEQSNRALRASEALYSAVGESLDYGVWACDATGRNTYASESLLKLIGLTQEQCSAGGWFDALHPDDRQGTQAAWIECTLKGTHWYREHRFLGVDGTYHPVLAQGVPIRDSAGAIVSWAGLNLDISRLKQTEEALREADRRKDDFLATLAHELRNPLAPILSSVKILNHANARPEHLDGAKQVIARQVQHMALLLDDLLDISRITSGRLELKQDKVDLSALIAMAVETARPIIERKRHVLTTRLPQEKITLWVDSLRIAQALTNLLNNAAKYTDEGGQLALTVEVQEFGMTVAVRDNGIGLSSTSLSKVFDMFSQVDSAKHQAEGGLGIGLSLAKGLVTLHGGTLEASSDGLGMGSAFVMQLPPKVLLASDLSAPTLITEPTINQVTPCNILVADDNRDAAQALALMLELAGNTVVTAFSGSEALQLCLNNRPQVAILDIGMPEMNGYDVARQIRLQPWGSEICLLALSGWGQPGDKQRARAAGFDHHFTKPVDSADLEQWLSSHVSQFQM